MFLMVRLPDVFALFWTDGGENTAATRFNHIKHHSPMRITFQLSSSQADAPETTDWGGIAPFLHWPDNVVGDHERGFVSKKVRIAISK